MGGQRRVYFGVMMGSNDINKFMQRCRRRLDGNWIGVLDGADEGMCGDCEGVGGLLGEGDDSRTLAGGDDSRTTVVDWVLDHLFLRPCPSFSQVGPLDSPACQSSRGHLFWFVSGMNASGEGSTAMCDE